MGTKAKSSSSDSKSAASDVPLAEWIAGGIGFVLVGFTVGYLLYAALTQEDRPPDIQVEVVSVVPVRAGYLAQFRATNHGDQSANDVHIIGIHGKGPDSEETEAVIDILPGHSQKSGGLFFSREPAPASLTVRASGYRDP